MIGYKNKEIEAILNVPGKNTGKEIWNSLDSKINDLRWKIQHLSTAQKFAERIRIVGKMPNFPHKEGVDDIDRYLEILPVDPKVASSDYETGSRELMKAHGIDKDEVVAQSNSPELIDLKERIYRSIKKQQILQAPAYTPEVYSLVDLLYTELFEKHGQELRVFHRLGRRLAKQGGEGRVLDDSYGIGFSAYLAEAIFIYCFIQILPLNEEQSENNN